MSKKYFYKDNEGELTIDLTSDFKMGDVISIYKKENGWYNIKLNVKGDKIKEHHCSNGYILYSDITRIINKSEDLHSKVATGFKNWLNKHSDRLLHEHLEQECEHITDFMFRKFSEYIEKEHLIAMNLEEYLKRFPTTVGRMCYGDNLKELDTQHLIIKFTYQHGKKIEVSEYKELYCRIDNEDSYIIVDTWANEYYEAEFDVSELKNVIVQIGDIKKELH